MIGASTGSGWLRHAAILFVPYLALLALDCVLGRSYSDHLTIEGMPYVVASSFGLTLDHWPPLAQTAIKFPGIAQMEMAALYTVFAGLPAGDLDGVGAVLRAGNLIIVLAASVAAGRRAAALGVPAAVTAAISAIAITQPGLTSYSWNHYAVMPALFVALGFGVADMLIRGRGARSTLAILGFSLSLFYGSVLVAVGMAAVGAVAAILAGRRPDLPLFASLSRPLPSALAVPALVVLASLIALGLADWLLTRLALQPGAAKRVLLWGAAWASGAAVIAVGLRIAPFRAPLRGPVAAAALGWLAGCNLLAGEWTPFLLLAMNGGTGMGVSGGPADLLAFILLQPWHWFAPLILAAGFAALASAWAGPSERRLLGLFVGLMVVAVAGLNLLAAMNVAKTTLEHIGDPVWYNSSRYLQPLLVAVPLVFIWLTDRNARAATVAALACLGISGLALADYVQAARPAAAAQAADAAFHPLVLDFLAREPAGVVLCETSYTRVCGAGLAYDWFAKMVAVYQPKLTPRGRAALDGRRVFAGGVQGCRATDCPDLAGRRVVVIGEAANLDKEAGRQVARSGALVMKELEIR